MLNSLRKPIKKFLRFKISYTSKCKIRNVKEQQDQEKMWPKQKFHIFVFDDNLIIISITLRKLLMQREARYTYLTN